MPRYEHSKSLVHMERGVPWKGISESRLSSAAITLPWTLCPPVTSLPDGDENLIVLAPSMLTINNPCLQYTRLGYALITPLSPLGALEPLQLGSQA